VTQAISGSGTCRLRYLLTTLLCFAFLICGPLQAEDEPQLQGRWQGLSIAGLLEELRAGGLPLVYSSNLVGPGLMVRQEPAPAGQIVRLREALLANGLDLQQLDGMYLVVRAPDVPSEPDVTATLFIVIANNGELLSPGLVTITGKPSLTAEQTPAPGIYRFDGLGTGRYEIEIATAGYWTERQQIELEEGQVRVIKVGLQLAPAELEQLSVSASRYILFSSSQFFIDQRAIQALPDLGEDPVRSVQRLPGAAAGGLSSRSHFRGGDSDETTIYLNGLQLLDPFHIRNFHNIFSTIDARAIAGVEAYTGGFPAIYGDSMSGVLLLDSQRPDRPRRTELGLSVYNTSALFSGFSAGGKVDWLVSARRSNLGYLLPKDLGSPDYFDVFTEIGIDLSDTTRLSMNGLYADDKIEVVLESDPAELERSVSNTHNLNLWLLLETEWTSDLASATVVSYSQLENGHSAEVNDPDQMTAAVENHRDVNVLGLTQDWRYEGITGHLLRWGLAFTRQEADYHFRSAAEYVAFYTNYPGIENPSFTAVDAAPAGNTYSLFLTDRWNLLPTTAVEVGFRWDRQTYTDPVFDDQFSPRVSLMQDLGPAIELRLTWGRYYQSQAVQRLQVEDGISHFNPPQRAKHWIASVQYRTDQDYRLRLEAYIKNYDRMSPRFENLFDSLALIPELEPDRVRLNPVSARARGIELTLEYRGESEVNWWATATVSRAADLINGDSQRRSWDQRYALQGGIAWERGPWVVGVALNLHTGWPITGMTMGYDEEDDEYFPIPGPRNAEQLNTYSSLDFRISRDFQVKNGQLSAFFEVTNLTNRRNQCCVEYDTEENEQGGVYLDVTYQNWLPIIPAIGVLWEF
jgi:hypothetical protein